MVASTPGRADHSEQGIFVSEVSPSQNASNYGTARTDTGTDLDPEVSDDLPAKPAPALWKDLPNKGQVAVLVIARLSEPLVQTSFQVGTLPISSASRQSEWMPETRC